MSLPRKLETAGTVLQLEHLKKAEAGHRLINKLSKPRRASKANQDRFWTPDTAPEDFSEFEDYNIGDVEAERELHQLLPALSEREQKLWELTVEMNEAGIRLDVEAVGWMERAAAEESANLTVEWMRLTGVKPGSKGAAKAVGLESLAKLAVRQALRRRDLPPLVREALRVRQMLARTSLRKLPRMRAQLCVDGRLRGAMIYGGAERTLRWAGSGVQLHNFPRGLGSAQAEAYDALERGVLHLLYDDVLHTLSDMLKGLMTGPWLIGDLGQIEARNLAWLAGDKKLLQDFANGVDIYCDMASTIYGRPVTKADYDSVLKVPKRQLGKMAILGCGYGMGANTFREQAEKDYDVLLDEDTAKKAVYSYRKRFVRVPALWYLLERGMVRAVETRANRIAVGPVKMGVRDIGGRHFAYIELPSGRAVYYFNPRVDRGEEGDEPPRISYDGRNRWTHKWGRIESYGGFLTENVDQADARDLLAHSMLELKRAGFRMAWTVHDENVAHDDGQKDALSEFERIMKEPPEWHAGIPLSVDAFQSWRYHK
jgi:DNA polymerase